MNEPTEKVTADALYTMDQMREYAAAFHTARIERRLSADANETLHAQNVGYSDGYASGVKAADARAALFQPSDAAAEPVGAIAAASLDVSDGSTMDSVIADLTEQGRKLPIGTSLYATPQAQSPDVAAEPVGYMMKHKTGTDIGFAWRADDPEFSSDWSRVPLFAEPSCFAADGRVIDKAMVKRLATQYELIDAPSQAVDQPHADRARSSLPIPVYQWRTKCEGEWQDVPLHTFNTIGPSFRRIVYAEPQPPSVELALSNDEFLALKTAIKLGDLYDCRSMSIVIEGLITRVQSTPTASDSATASGKGGA